MALGFILAQPHLAEGFIFVVLIVLIGTPFWLYKAYKVPAKRRIFLINTLIWAMAFAAAIAVHGWRAHVVRQQADAIVIKIQQYQQQTGHYPATLDEIDISRAELKHAVGMSGYSLSEQHQPFFAYASTWAPFDTYVYDFSAREWYFMAD